MDHVRHYLSRSSPFFEVMVQQMRYTFMLYSTKVGLFQLCAAVNPRMNLKLLVMVGQKLVMVGQETVMVGQIPTHGYAPVAYIKILSVRAFFYCVENKFYFCSMHSSLCVFQCICDYICKILMHF